MGCRWTLGWGGSPSLLGLFPGVELPSFHGRGGRGARDALCGETEARHNAVCSGLCFPRRLDGDPILLCPPWQREGPHTHRTGLASAVGGQERPGSAAAAVPTAWPSPACPRLIPLPQTLSLTPADKSHFQDGLIQFSTDFLPGPVTYGSPAGAGRHVTPQRPPSLEQLSTGCRSPPCLISPAHAAGAGGVRILPWRGSTRLPAPSIPGRIWPRWHWGGGGTQGCWGWYLGMPVGVPEDAGGDTQGCWRWYPVVPELVARLRGGDFVLFPRFLGFSLGLMSMSGSLSLSVFSSLLPLEANG